VTAIELEDGSRLGVLDTLEQLQAVTGQPSSRAVRKDIGHIDGHFADFIARSPFALLGTASAAGACDVSPRGDHPGFAHVLDSHHIAVPDRPGNRRVDSLHNIVETGRAGLLFIVPGSGNTVRVNGRAALTEDPALVESMAVDGKAPKLAIIVTVEEAYLHCPKAFRRSQLWDPATWSDPSELASPGCIYRDQLGLDQVSVEDIDRTLEESNRTTLW
jgi:uncharacterized protein